MKNGTVIQSLTVNAADQITTTGYGYDTSGNTTTAPAVGSSVTYNGAEQMTGRTTSDGYSTTTTAYGYAGTDQTELITLSGDRSYAYGRANTAGVPIIESYTKGASTYSYTYDPQGTPLAVEGANSHYLALDGLGSPTALVNHDGVQTAAYSYDPYGQATATAVGGSGAIGIQIYGYAGGFDDPTSSLVHYGERWYDPTSGRWTQQDSLEALADPTRANRYEYAASNPINYIDPTGRDADDIVGLIIDIQAAVLGAVSGAVCTASSLGIGAIGCGIGGGALGLAYSYGTRNLLEGLGIITFD